MMNKLNRRLGIIGTGRMGSALIRGLTKAGLLAPGEIIASDVNQKTLDQLKKETGIQVTADNTLVVKSSEMILLALKPDLIRPVLREVRGALSREHLVISIAAGVPIKTIEDAIGKECRVIRVMPNTPCLIGAGASAFSPGQGATHKDRKDVRSLLEAVGMTVELPEKQLDAVTGLSGSGPAFVFMVIEALSDGGVKMGLPRPVAMQLATQTVLGAARMVQETGKPPGELKDQVASPGGTTIAGIAALEQGGLRAALIGAVEAATRRSIELRGKE
jgi:pyrroline-5-carboxylate reductase